MFIIPPLAANYYLQWRPSFSFSVFLLWWSVSRPPPCSHRWHRRCMFLEIRCWTVATTIFCQPLLGQIFYLMVPTFPRETLADSPMAKRSRILLVYTYTHTNSLKINFLIYKNFISSYYYFDFSAEFLRLPYSPPYLSLKNFKSSIPVTGLNYASGGCGILPETGRPYVRIWLIKFNIFFSLNYIFLIYELLLWYYIYFNC